MYQRRKSWAIAILPDTDLSDVWRPPVDVLRTRTGWLLRFDLAGVQREDIRLTVQDRRIGVSGLRRNHIVEEGSSFYSMEISWNRFERTIELPCSLAAARLVMDLHNGILLVRVLLNGVTGEEE